MDVECHDSTLPGPCQPGARPSAARARPPAVEPRPRFRGRFCLREAAREAILFLTWASRPGPAGLAGWPSRARQASPAGLAGPAKPAGQSQPGQAWAPSRARRRARPPAAGARPHDAGNDRSQRSVYAGSLVFLCRPLSSSLSSPVFLCRPLSSSFPRKNY